MQTSGEVPAQSGGDLKKVLLVAGGILLLLLMLAALLLPQICSARETARGNTCRSNMRALANAVFQYANDNGTYPGYMNVLERTDRKPFVDPDTGEVTPVSWVVMILPYVDRRMTFDQWRLPPEERAKDAPPQNRTRFLTDQYIELFLCPSDPQQSKTGTPISFVANSGLPDRSSVVLGDESRNDLRIPRDWAANGMFFDHFSQHRLVKTDPATRGPMEYMNDARVKDPHAMTILLTENIDATSYVFRSATHAAENWKACEVQTGCIWRPGPIDATKKPPTMSPPVATLNINKDRGKGDGLNYDYCRPSSNHPQSVNVAFVGQNVAQLRDTVSYFVFAKLMASDDEHVVDADAPFRTYEINEADVSP
jgi:hypothetical protein